MFNIITSTCLLFIILYISIYFSKPASKCSSTALRTCGKESHFSHSDGGGIFSWNAIRLSNRRGMSNPYLFIMFETYTDGTSDHYIVDIIDLPMMTADFITKDGKLNILRNNGLSVGFPDKSSESIINNTIKVFFDMLPCYNGPYSGRGVQ